MIDEAIKIARRSSTGKYMTGAVIIRKGKILSNGWNHIPNHKHPKLFSLHAEMHALARARHLDLHGAVVYIAALSRKSGNATLAKPCLNCAIALRAAGIEHFVCTSSNGVITDTLDLEDFKIYRSPDG